MMTNKRKEDSLMKIIVQTVIATTVMSILLYCLSWGNTHYVVKATITRVNSSIITATDERGYVWDFEGSGLHRNDKVKLIMNSQHTDLYIFDDTVDDVRLIR